MPRDAAAAVDQELDDWARWAVEGHFRAQTPWFGYHEAFRDVGARLVGARPGEVVLMNTLTVNLHLMLVSFYRPEGRRRKILIEDHCFPSDRYAVTSHLAARGLDPNEEIAVAGVDTTVLSTDAVVEQIRRIGPELALVMLGGVNYFTGQRLDMERIGDAAREAGSVVGFDLAHAVGNVPLRLHDWNVDFAVWCSYKYLNGGPGAIAGCFVHERHGQDHERPRFAGWWGNDPAIRFRMHENLDFTPRDGADGWQLSNPPILSMAPLHVSLEQFDRAGMPALREKSVRLTAFLEASLHDALGEELELLTPTDPEARGCQLSLRVCGRDPRAVFASLREKGMVADFREPDVIRVSPVPLYNRFEDVARFSDALGEIIGAGPR